MPIEDIQDVYPDGYDDKTTIMSKPKNRESFTLKSGITVSATSIILNGDASGIEEPCLLLFDGGEIWYLEEGDVGAYDSTNDETEISILYSQRAKLGTNTQIHTTGEDVFTFFSGKQHELLLNIIMNLEKFPLVVGKQADPPTLVGEAYIDSNGDIYVSFDGSSTYVKQISGSHTNLDDVPDATNVHGDQYIHDGNLTTWHGTIAGGHITDGDDHTHLVDASAVKRVAHGSVLPSVEKVGQIFLLDDQLYFSYDGATFEEFFGIPQGSILPFPPASGCPSGWSESTALNGSYAKTVTGGTGSKTGSNTHTHTISEIAEHSHSIAQDTTTTSDPGNHSHSYYLYGGGAIRGILVTTYVASTGNTSSYNHDHTGSADADATDGLVSGTFVSSITSDSASSEPPYITMTWCKKD